MLTGRESLIRLIGHRRRFLPNRQSLLSTPAQSSLNLCNGDTTGGFAAEGSSQHENEVSENFKSGERVGKMSTSGSVACPVCGSSIRDEDYVINSHLNACLARGTKRKLTQQTLLQLNFCSASNDKTSYSDSDLKTNLEENAIHNLSNSAATEEKHNEQFESPLNFLSTESPISDENKSNIKFKADSSSSFNKDKMPKFKAVTSIDDIFGLTLDTFIVGRRFGDEAELNLGMMITLQRDPNNVKDPNAIKVLSAYSGTCKVLGFLPQGLAHYLSPLIDKYCLSFQNSGAIHNLRRLYVLIGPLHLMPVGFASDASIGCVTSLPKHSLDVIPIQIKCEKRMLVIEKEDDELNIFNSLWENILIVIESSKNVPPCGAKYQQNFSLLTQEVLRSNSHLFSDDEIIFLESFASLSNDSQKLFVRLHTRKGPWFRMSNICYPEILDSQEAAKGLSATGYIHLFDSVKMLRKSGMEEVLNLLTVSELRAISSTLKKKSKNGTRKQDLVALLLYSYKDGLCPLLPKLVLDMTGPCICISSTAESLFWRVQRLFFLNGEQDLSAFLLVDLGRVKYPTYNCIISDRIFSNRSGLLAYEKAIEVAQIMDESLDESNSDLVLRCIEISDSLIFSSSAERSPSLTFKSVDTFSCFSASWVYSKVVLLGVSFLEHERRYHDAIILLKRLLNGFTCDGRRGYWTLRLSIDLEHIGLIEESLLIAENGLLDPWVRAGSRMALQRRVLRLGKPPRRWKVPSYSVSIKRKITEVHVQGRPLNCEIGTKSRFYGEDGNQCGVEQLALQYYGGEGGGWQGIHTESGIWLTLFGIIMWDVVFADIPNVFLTRFQTAPLDLETDNFYIARKNLIESHLEKVQEGMAEEILIKSWESNIGTACKGVNWERHSLSDLRAAAVCIGGNCMASILRNLAQDYRSWSSGMPDLLLWRFNGDYEGEAKLVEVKGPRDILSEQQRAWLLLLMDCGFNVEVCKVSPFRLSS